MCMMVLWKEGETPVFISRDGLTVSHASDALVISDVREGEMKKWMIMIGMLVFSVQGIALANDVSEESRIEREAALVEWLGVARYFHPADGVEETDWEGVLHKALKVAAQAEDDETFVDEVTALIEPATVGMVVGAEVSGQGVMPEDCDAAPLRWTHRGFDAWPVVDEEHIANHYQSERSEWPGERLGVAEDELPRDWKMNLPGGRSVSLPLALCPEQAAESEAVKPPETDFGEDHAAMARYAIAQMAPVFRHFYPYQTHMSRDWDEWLRSELARAHEVEDREGLHVFLQHFVAPLNDGHLMVLDTRAEGESGFLPIDIVWHEDKAVVIHINERAESDLQLGDRIKSVNGEPTKEWLETRMARYSGTSQWRQERARREFLGNDRDGADSIELELIRDGDVESIEQEYSAPGMAHAPEREGFDELGDGVVYVDLRAKDMTALNERMDTLIEAETVVFDLRGYPTDAGAGILTHLLEEQDEWGDWMRVLMATGPGGEFLPYQAHGWHIPPSEDHIGGKVAFLSNGRAISYTESVVGMVKKHELGKLVGGSTAGANGNVIMLEGPDGLDVMFTGMQVLNPKGRTFHAEGLHPDIEVTPDPERLARGEDPVLEAALEALGADPELAYPE